MIEALGIIIVILPIIGAIIVWRKPHLVFWVIGIALPLETIGVLMIVLLS